MSITANAQENNPLLVSGQLLEKAGNLYDSGQYKKAIAVYGQIDRNDSNYVQALYGISSCYFADSEFTVSVAYARKALSFGTDPEREPDLYDQIANDYNEQDASEEAIRIYDSAIRKYPGYTLLYLNKGTALIRLKRFAEAESVLQQALLINPYSYSCHYKLGYAALNQGKLIPAFLCFMGYLALSPDGRFHSYSIGWLNNISHNKDTIQTFLGRRKEDPIENYQLLEQILQSKIALDKNYKIQLDLDDPISRQIQVLLEKIDYAPGEKDFYMQYYVPWFKKIFVNHQLEPFVYRMFWSVDLPIIQNYLKKHKKEVQAVGDESGSYLDNIRSTRELNYGKRSADTAQWTFSQEGFTGHGTYDRKADKLLGPWDLLFTPGNVRGKGLYDADGKRDGPFTWYYFNGSVRGREIYSHGKQQGEETYYFTNGQRSAHSWYKDDQLDGESTSWFWVGTPHTITHYRSGKEDGIKITFYSNGDTSLLENYVAGVLNGPIKSWSKLRSVDLIASYRDGVLDGEYKKFFPNGQMSSAGIYKAGKQEGEWKWWFADGRLRMITPFVNDLAEGEHKEYYDNGALAESYTARAGKIDGDQRQFDEDGKPYAVLTYSNGSLAKARYFDKTGKVIGESTGDRKAIDLVQYLPDGSKRSETPYDKKGNLTGTQTFYYENGSILETDVYRDGTEQGPSTSWFLNGKKRSETPYVDGKMEGYHQTWFSTGQIREEGWYREDKAQGYWLYHDELGALTDSVYYQDDDLEGYKTSYLPNGKKDYEARYHSGWLTEWIQYDTNGLEFNHIHLPAGTGKFRLLYPGGQPRLEVEYLRSEMVGTRKEWYFDGKAQAISHFTAGMQDSSYTTWFYNGAVNTQGQFVLGERTGPWKYFNSKGQLIETEDYVHGDLDGAQTAWYENGKMENVTHYKQGKKEGVSKTYDPDGTLAYQVTYLHDEPVSYSYLDKRDSLVPEIPLLFHAGKVKAYFPDGKTSGVFEYAEGLKHGDIHVYHRNGQLMNLGHRNYGVLDGEYLTYYEDGKVKESETYRLDNLNGLQKEYNEKGVLVEERNYYNGTPHGITRLYDDAGRLTETDCYYYGTLISVKK